MGGFYSLLYFLTLHTELRYFHVIFYLKDVQYNLLLWNLIFFILYTYIL